MNQTRRTGDVARVATFPKCVLISVVIQKKSVPKVTIAFVATIELRISTTLRSTNQSSAQHILTKLTSVNMGKSVPLHITKTNCP
jgi:hypothetical protein